jgi:hypothetical protein
MRSKYLFNLIALLAPLAPAVAAEEGAEEKAASKEAPPPVLAPMAAAPVQQADPPGLWASFEYLNWQIRSGPSVPLIAAGNPLDPIPGAIGQPGTRVLNGRGLDYDTRDGARLTLGAWLNSDRSRAVELSGFVLFNKAGDSLTVSTPMAGASGIYVPAVRTDLGRLGAVSISDPLSGFAGFAATGTTSQLWGLEANLIENVARNECISLDVIAGLKYLDLLERLDLRGVSNDLILANSFTFTDSFRTHNQFYGAQVGGQATYRHEWFFATLRGCLAVGVNEQTVEVNGAADLSGTVTGTFPGGFFSQPSNMGTRSKCDFSVVPSAGLKVGVQCLECLSVFAGYDCLYWHRTVRPGGQIDTRVDTPLSLGGTVPVRAFPAPEFNRTDFWAHGFSVGLDLRY